MDGESVKQSVPMVEIEAELRGRAAELEVRLSKAPRLDAEYGRLLRERRITERWLNTVRVLRRALAADATDRFEAGAEAMPNEGILSRAQSRAAPLSVVPPERRRAS
jgi:hypothetical protein